MHKLRVDTETLVAGHDFSPQWPGVVRAVHEQMLGEKLPSQVRPLPGCFYPVSVRHNPTVGG